jgi:hypothetical protein
MEFVLISIVIALIGTNVIFIVCLEKNKTFISQLQSNLKLAETNNAFVNKHTISPKDMFSAFEINPDSLKECGIEFRSVYKHYKRGYFYKPLCLVNSYSTDQERYPTMVLYAGLNGKLWCKTVYGFNKTMSREVIE